LERVIDAETYCKPIPDELTLSSIGEKKGWLVVFCLHLMSICFHYIR
jgi:hypothetical protein